MRYRTGKTLLMRHQYLFLIILWHLANLIVDSFFQFVFLKSVADITANHHPIMKHGFGIRLNGRFRLIISIKNSANIKNTSNSFQKGRSGEKVIAQTAIKAHILEYTR